MVTRIVLSALAAAALLWGGACYEDAAAGPAGPTRGGSLAWVFLTDAPFPYDSVASVNVHVVRIEANAEPGAGTACLRATSEGKTSQATITVHLPL